MQICERAEPTDAVGCDLVEEEVPDSAARRNGAAERDGADGRDDCPAHPATCGGRRPVTRAGPGAERGERLREERRRLEQEHPEDRELIAECFEEIRRLGAGKLERRYRFRRGMAEREARERRAEAILRERELREARRRRLERARASTPPRLRGARLDDRVPGRHHGRTLRDLLEGVDLEGDVLLLGANGRGKSWIAAAVARDFGQVWLGAESLGFELRESFNTTGGESEPRILERWSNEPRLVVDDLMKAQATAYNLSRLSWLVAQRVEWLRPTIVTCATSLEEVARVDSHLASRLSGFQRVFLRGPDLRLRTEQVVV